MRLPPTAFAYYLGLGPERSYQKVAEYYGVSRQAVAKRGRKENWRKQISIHDEQERQRANQEASDNLAEMNDRHLKTSQVIQKKALESLRATNTMRPKEAAMVLVAGMKIERVVRLDDRGRPIHIKIG